MIISEATKTLIATPTKCGTTTLEAVARRSEREGDGAVLRVLDEPDPNDTRRRQHRMCPPPGKEDWTRLLLVRNPYDRLTSIYEYLRAPANYSQWGARRVQGREWPGERGALSHPPMSFRKFLFWLELEHATLAEDFRDWGASRSYRSPWVWTDTLKDSWRFWSRDGDVEVGLLRLENLWEDLAAWLGEGVVNMKPLHSNRSTGRKHADWKDYYKRDEVVSADLLDCAEACDLFGYDERP